MQSNRLKFYYLLKPYIPWSMRMWMRRRRALAKRPLVENVWPIKPGTERPPVGWPGWPEGKQFAVVLTHDVEGPVGLSRIKPLMELEMKLGFRSCFNLIPEGPYTATRELRDYITSHGFEVGVHDLHHDGRLFGSRAHFQKCAGQINRYLKAWNAVGFRAGFMHHNLEWLHDLDIQYDCSTFDTDPFEPQPDGVETIFPFWVPRPEARDEIAQSSKSVAACSSLKGRGRGVLESARQLRGAKVEGYVELPYTLPQDSTLFLLLREETIGIWKGKIDWIAEKGGMVMVDVHPDFACDGRSVSAAREYPQTYYKELLDYILTRYAGQFWAALPRELSAYLLPHFSSLGRTLRKGLPV